MLVISNNCEEIGVLFPENAVIRINTAWVNTIDALRNNLDCFRKLKKQIYLDYPLGRRKPPTPKMTWEELLPIVCEYQDVVKYFAWSNAEKVEELEFARMKLPEKIMLVPKIETLLGVLHLEDIVKASKTKLIMIDKEDLASACRDGEIYQHFLEYTRKKAKELGIESIELKSVVFA